jgi:hypothetical protein
MPSLLPLGSYVDSDLGVKGFEGAQDKYGNWHNRRPLPYYSFRTRLVMAWHVLTYKADPLYWSIDLANNRYGWHRNLDGLNARK